MDVMQDKKNVDQIKGA